MKKFIQICVVVLVCLSAATSAGFMKIPERPGSLNAVETDSKQDSIPVADMLVELKNEAFQRRPIEPGVLFLFGIGLIGIIGIHRLKFH